ncbi:MAG: alanine racemase C-terminal domain-containing protein [Caldilineaceae bacterium]
MGGAGGAGQGAGGGRCGLLRQHLHRRPRAPLPSSPWGYADGFPRSPRTWGHVLVGGQFAPIRGRVCMDQTMIDVTEILEDGGSVRAGDEVVLIGARG